MTPDLRPYVTLLKAMLSNRLTPAEFQAIIIPLFKNDTIWRPPEIYGYLNSIFLAAEAFTLDAQPEYPYAVTEEQLRQIAAEVLKNLEEAVDSV